MPATGADTSIADDVACARCGYNLRGLSSNQPCPECGLATHRTMSAGGQLIDAPPRWVAFIASGTTLLFAAYSSPLIAVALVKSKVYEHYDFAKPLVLFIIVLMHAIGAWLITVAELGPPGPRHRWRRAAIVALRVLATGPVAVVLWFIYRARQGSFVSDDKLLLAIAALLPCPALTMTQLQHLTRRLGRPRVAEHAFLAGFDLSLTLTVSAAMAVLPLGEQWVVWIAGCLVAACVFWVWSVWTLRMIARSLWLVRRQARAAWRAADAACG